MKRYPAIAIAVAVILGLVGCKPIVDPGTTKSSEAEMKTFAFESARNAVLGSTDYTGVYNALTGTYNVTGLEVGTSVTGLKATFTLSAGATVSVNGSAQVSGQTSNDYSSDVTYVVTAENGTTTRNYKVHVVAPALGMTTFSIDNGTNSVPVPFTVDNTALTITGEMPYSYASALSSARTVTFTHNGTSLSHGADVLSSGTSTLDLSTGSATLTLTGPKGSKDYTVTVTAATSANTDSSLADLKVTYNGVIYTGAISGTAIAFDLPPNTDLAAMTATFTLGYPAAASLKDGSTVLTSGTSVLDLSAAKTLTVTAESGATTDYTVTADNTPALAIVGFDSDSTGDNLKWIDVKIYDKAAVGASTSRLIAYSTSYEEILIPDFNVLPFWASVADGDTIRVWDAYALVTDDVVIGDNSAGVWDVRNKEASTTTIGKYHMHASAGLLTVDVGGSLMNALPYRVSNSTATSLTTNATGTALLTTLATEKFWATASGTAFALTDSYTSTTAYAVGSYFHLVSGKTHGLKPADWERIASGQEFYTFAPTFSGTMNMTDGGTLTANVACTYTGTGTHSIAGNIVTIDVTNLTSTATSGVNYTATLTTADGGATWTGTFTAPTDIAVPTSAGAKTLRVTAQTVVNGVTLNNTAATASFTVLAAKAVTVSSFSADNSVAIVGESTPVVFTAVIDKQNGAAISTVTADMSGIGQGSAQAFTYVSTSGTTETWTCSTSVTSSAGIGAYSIPLTVAFDGAASPKTGSTCAVNVVQNYIKVSSFTTSPTSMAFGTTGTVLTLDATLAFYGAAQADTVVVDLTAVNGGTTLSQALTGSSPTDTTWTDASFTVPSTLAAGRYEITLTVTDSTSGTATATYTAKTYFMVGYAYTSASPYTTGFESVYDADGATLLTAASGTSYFAGATSAKTICLYDSSSNHIFWVLPVGTAATAYVNQAAACNYTAGTNLWGMGFNQQGQALTSTTPFLNPTSLSFDAKGSGATTAYTIVVEYSADGTNWTVAATYASNTFNATKVTKTVSLGLTGAYFIRIRMSARTGNSFYFDNISLY